MIYVWGLNGPCSRQKRGILWVEGVEAAVWFRRALFPGRRARFPGRRARSPEASRMVLFKKDQGISQSQGAIVGGGSDSPSLPLHPQMFTGTSQRHALHYVKSAWFFMRGPGSKLSPLASAQSAASPFPPKTPTREPISSWKEKCSLGLEGLSGKTVSIATPGFQWLGWDILVGCILLQRLVLALPYKSKVCVCLACFLHACRAAGWMHAEQ